MNGVNVSHLLACATLLGSSSSTEGLLAEGGGNPFRGVEEGREGSNPSPLPERGKCSGHAYEGLKAGGSGGCDAVIVDVLLCQKG